MDEFIMILLEQIRCKRARDGIAKEIMDHIEDAAQALEHAGLLAVLVEGVDSPFLRVSPAHRVQPARICCSPATPFRGGKGGPSRQCSPAGGYR